MSKKTLPKKAFVLIRLLATTTTTTPMIRAFTPPSIVHHSAAVKSSSSYLFGRKRQQVPTRQTLDMAHLCSMPPQMVDWNKSYRRLLQLAIPPIPKPRNARRYNKDYASTTSAASMDQARWIWTEFVYGFRYMARVFVWLQLGSFVGTALRTRLLDKNAMMMMTTMFMDKNNKVLLAKSVGPLHWIDHWLKTLVWRITKPPFLIKTCIVSPIIEELTYRGLGHVLGRLGYHISLLLLAWIASFGAIAIRVWMTAMYLINPLWITASLIRIPFLDLGGWVQHCGRLAQLCACAPMAWKLLPLAQWRDIDGDDDGDEDDGKNLQNGTIHLATERIAYATLDAERRDILVSQKAYSIVRKNGSYEPPPDFKLGVHKWSAFAARLQGAIGFGLAHFGVGVKSGPASLQSLQKCIGTFCSSMLVESRLVCRRRNLWCAMGAHVAFNVLAVVMAVLRAITISVYKINYRNGSGTSGTLIDMFRMRYI